MRSWRRINAASVGFVLLLPTGATEAAEIKVVATSALISIVDDLRPRFERATGQTLIWRYDFAPSLRREIESGAAFDVAILSGDIDDLIKRGAITAGTSAVLGRTGIGVAVRKGAAKPDVSTVDAFKQVLLRAQTVAVPASTSGIWLTTELFPRLGIAQKINAKVVPRGSDATGLVASGGADVAVQPVSEIVHAAGVDLAGVFLRSDQRMPSRSARNSRNEATTSSPAMPSQSARFASSSPDSVGSRVFMSLLDQ